jgi:peptidoglycan hydrolase-like protein with peptidoglycan-binding domain
MRAIIAKVADRGIEISAAGFKPRDFMTRWNLIASTLLACGLLFGASVSAHPQSASSPSTSALKKASKRSKHRRRHHEPKQMAPGPDRISEIQSALARDGYYKGDPNGKWDSVTVGAMEKFQADHGLDSTGKIDALTLQKLGLGSDIAGVDAPRLPAPAPGNSAQPPATPKPDSPKPAGAPGTVPLPITPRPSPATSGPGLPR